MIELIVVGEGQTEETFVREVVAPQLTDREIFLQPRLIATSPGTKGGALSRDRVLRFLRNTLRERTDTYVTTFFDLYRLPADFPGIGAGQADPLARCGTIQDSLKQAATQLSDCRADRFFAHIQPYEFEALLFSDVTMFASVESAWNRSIHTLQRARDEASTPEHINDGPNTHPSARLQTTLQPRYRKPLHGSVLAAAIGLARIRSECRHFDAWLTRIESLQPLR